MATLTPGEASVIELHDEGLDAIQIASEMDISVARAKAIISTFNDDPRFDRIREGRVRRGTIKLLKALTKVGYHQSMPEMKGIYR